MNTLELMMNDRHLDEWIKIREIVDIDKSFQSVHMTDNFIICLWWNIHSLTCFLILKLCPRKFSESCTIFFYMRLDLEDEIIGEHRSSSEHIESILQSKCIVIYFFGLYTCKYLTQGIRLKQLIMCCDDIFDL